MYSLTPSMMNLTSATLLNLSLLTSDVYAILIGVLVFQDQVKINCFLIFIYFLAFFFIFYIFWNDCFWLNFI